VAEGLQFGSQHGLGSVSSKERPDQPWRLFGGYRRYLLIDVKKREPLRDLYRDEFYFCLLLTVTLVSSDEAGRV
jgi:hypothetical protein